MAIPGIDQAIEKGIHKNPLTYVLVMLLAGGGSTAFFNPFVMAGDFDEFQRAADTRLTGLEDSVRCLRHSIDSNSLSSEVRQVNSEIFQLTRLRDAGQATSRDLQRLDDLRTDKEDLQRKLNSLNGAGCAN